MRFGLVEDLRNPVQWRRPFPDLYRDLFAQVRHAEEVGFDHVWLTEHHFTEDGYNPSLLSTAAAIAAQTTRIRIASFILLLPFNHPVRVAEDVANVDIISTSSSAPTSSCISSFRACTCPLATARSNGSRGRSFQPSVTAELAGTAWKARQKTSQPKLISPVAVRTIAPLRITAFPNRPPRFQPGQHAAPVETSASPLPKSRH